MAAQSSIFPIFLRAEYREDANGIPQFISRIQQAAKISEAEMKRVGAALNNALAAPRTGAGALDLGTAQLREQIKAQQQAAIAAREVQQATLAAANASGTFNAAFTPTINAYRDAAKAAEGNVAALRAQLAALEQVQSQLNQTASATTALTGENLRLAQAEAGAANGATMLAAIYRGTAAELGRVANSARESASAFELLFQAQDARASSAAQAFFNTALGIDRQTKSAQESARAFEELFAEQNRAQLAARQITSDYLALAQAEAAAANGAALVGAALRGTALEADRVTKSARESAGVFQQAFAEQEAAVAELNREMQRLTQAIDPAAAAQQRFDRSMELVNQALRENIVTAERAAQMQGLLRAELAQNANQTRASRTAFIQLGQQLQDVAVQAQMGTNAFLIFGQQAPQAAFALSGLADSANRTQAAIGRVATFLSGPWGAAIFVAVAALGPFVQKLFESEEAADASGRAQRSLVEVLNDSTSSYEEVTQAINEYNRAQERAREVTILTIQAEAEAIAQRLRKAIATRELIKANLDLYASELRNGPTGPGGQGQIAASIVASQLSSEVAAQDAQIATLMQGAANVRVAAATEIARIQSDTGARITAGFDVLRDEAKRTIKDVDALTARLTQLNQDEATAQEAARKKDRSERTRREPVDREPEQLARFGDQAAERVARINDRFAEQTRLVTQSLQANRELDGIIAETNRRMATAKNLTAEQRKEFEGIKSAALDAKDVIDDALRRPFEDLRLESEQRLQIERLLAEGKVDEAAALQAIIQLERQLGTEVELRAALQRAINEGNESEADRIRNLLANYGELIDGARARVLLEQRLTREYRDQQAVFNAQLDVINTVRRDLTDILSGRGADFFGNFRRALQDLQGQRLFEDIFGDTFRQIENELQRNTPQGRANAAYTDQVNKTAETTGRLESALDRLTGAMEDAGDRLRADFDREFRPANDNGGFSPAASIAMAALQATGQTGLLGITVDGRRGREVQIERRSIKELAEMMADATVKPLVAELEDILGPRFAGMLGGVLSGALAGLARGGKPGAVLGGLQGLFGKDSAVGKELGKALDGTQTGTTVNAIGRSLGFRGSRSGAQIGAAIGSLTGIPGGDIIGAIAGNIIGGVLRSTPRASATIGNLGGSLGVTGTRGNSRRLREASGGLAGNVLDAIANIADQLGASVDATRGAVSIGMRNDNIRVDPTGQGRTRTRRGAIDFGDDTEAAIAFAVRDLIEDGVITGLRAAEERLLQAGDDVEAALRDVLTFRSVFDQLEEIRNPVGFAITQLDREFEKLIDLFERAGASTEEFASLEELYNIRRAEAIKDASDRVVGSLRQLLNDLTVGDSGLSLRTRRNNALGQFNDLAARVAAGDTTAFDDFADVSQQLLDIERQLFGSTQSYFDRLAQVTQLTERAIAEQTNVTSIGAGSPSPFDDRTSVARAVESASSEQVGWLRAINDNLIALNPGLRTISSPGRLTGAEDSSLPVQIANF